MRKITLPLYLSTLFTYIVFVIGMMAIFGSDTIVEALQGTSPRVGSPLSNLFLHVADWFTGPIGSGILTTTFTLFTLILMIMTLLLGTNFVFSLGRRIEISDSTSLTPVDSVLSFLEPFVPARTMKEVAGDVREAIDLLHEEGASPWRLHRQLALGVIWILLDASREASRKRNN
ncbi:MAG TPA: hypothetical protein VN493_30965 [Thermoanaerobaculia bacterium]|nr:hypothetical protein [Thermoanaerobaculia bacterium]